MLIRMSHLASRVSRLSRQYVGASVVIAGIVISLIPTLLRHPKEDDDVDAATQALWSVVQVGDCVRCLACPACRFVGCKRVASC